MSNLDKIATGKSRLASFGLDQIQSQSDSLAKVESIHHKVLDDVASVSHAGES